MRLKKTLLVVGDIAASRRFYEEVLGLQAREERGDGVSFDGFALQTRFLELLEREDLLVRVQPNDHELCFETEDWDAFLARLEGRGDIDLLHEERELPDRRRVIRFYDPDFHIVRVAEARSEGTCS